MTLQHTVICPGQIWMGQSRDHRWRVRIVGLSLSAVEFETLAKGAHARSRVRARHQLQWMKRVRFLSDFALERDVCR